MNCPLFADSHTHLYIREFDSDLENVVTRALQSGVNHLFLPAIDSHHHEKMLRVAGTYPGLCHPMMGLHPTSVNEDFREELEIVQQYLSDNRGAFCAIGEIGIDLYWDKSHETEQIEAFQLQLGLAAGYGLPVVIHTRNSIDVALQVLVERNDPRLRGVFHCFSGNSEQARQVTQLGFMLGIGGVVTYRKSDLLKVVESTDLNHLLLETDAPWLPPVPHRGQRNEPSFLPLVAEKIAEIKKIPLEEVADVTRRNALRMFGRDE